MCVPLLTRITAEFPFKNAAPTKPENVSVVPTMYSGAVIVKVSTSAATWTEVTEAVRATPLPPKSNRLSDHLVDTVVETLIGEGVMKLASCNSPDPTPAG